MPNSSLLLKIAGSVMVPIPALLWHRAVAKEARAMTRALASLPAEHQRVRSFVVQALPQAGEPLTAEHIAAQLGLSPDRVRRILDALERGLTFVARNEAGAVSWAYPVTVDATPHHLTFKTGERMTAA